MLEFVVGEESMTIGRRTDHWSAVNCRAVCRIAVMATSALLASTTGAQEPAPPAERGIFVTVANPITSEVVSGIRERIARDQRDKPIAKIVFDFNPDGREAASVDYGPCLDLADAISDLNVRTIAFVHGAAIRHTVLPILACQELVMSSDAILGPVITDKDGPLNDLKKATYERIANKDRQALVLKMIDRSVAVLEGRLPNGAVTYFDARKRGDAERAGVVGIVPQPGLAAGALAKYTTDDALRFGLCQAKLESKQEVAERYRMPATTLREDPLQGRTPDAWLIKVQGTIDRGLAETLRRKIDRASRQGANILFLQLDVAGGEPVVAGDLAQELRKLKGRDGLPIVTVAYIPHAAPDLATFLALGCTEIVMGKNATLGQFKHLIEQPDPRQFPMRRNPRRGPPMDLATVGTALTKLAEDQGYSPLLIQALFDQSVEVWRVVSQKGTTARKFVTKEELDSDRRGEQKWGQPSLVKPAGQLLELTADKAKDYGIATGIVNNPDDPHELYAIYGVTKAREPPADWLDKLAAFLSDPAVAMFLVILGITCLILELKMPGVGIPGVIAAVCFVLFFWSQTQNSEMAVLAVLLFILGLVLIGIEIFLLPGLGVTGISGILLVLAGLALATVEHLPQTSGEYVNFGFKLIQLGGAMVGSTIAAFIVARYLPHIPYANRLVLSPPGEKEGTENTTAASATYEALSALLGAVGTAATALRPAGMARFGDAYVDVVSEGNFIPTGARIQVIEIEGNRVVVKEV
jgi:membrane-bound serine protease (ClpP class)